MSQQMTCILHMFCFKITYVPRFILCLLYSFISSCCVELLLIGTSVDWRICLHKFLSILNLNYFVLSEFIWNFFVSEMSALNLCKAFLWSLLSAGILLGLWIITEAALQVFTNRNNLKAHQGSAPWLFGPSMSEQMCVPREGHADGCGCSLLHRRSTCVWIRLLRKVNIPSVFGEINYRSNYCLCYKNKAL